MEGIKIKEASGKLARWLLGVIGFVSLAGIGSYAAVDHYFSEKVKSKLEKVQVVGIPEDYGDETYKPYEGPHPSTIRRPRDTFNYPIPVGGVGPIESLFSGPSQYPFLCLTEKSGLGQPLIDNHEGVGIPIYEEDSAGKKTSKVVGYSKDCSIKTRAYYFYNKKGTERFFPLESASDDIEKITINGKDIDFIVRIEVGTINRYIYGVATLKGEGESLDKPNGSYWNKKLIYQFRGGVGIGKRQGRLTPASLLNRRHDELKRGYAIAYSTGNQTSNHYNIWRAEELVMRVKNQFVALYGEPDYTVGIGGSGGAIQQYLIAQNHSGLLDGAITLYSYPDMISQTLYGFDCELLEYYFDVTDRDNSKWETWGNRSNIQGLNALPGIENKFSPYYMLAKIVKGDWLPKTDGMTECVNGWRGLVQLTNNPHFVHFSSGFSDEVNKKVHWTHWDDLKSLYGKSASGYANSTWDNVGVQYGLDALKKHQISIKEFLTLNASVGGWKPAEKLQQVNYWKLVEDVPLSELSPWSDHNMYHGDLKNPAARSEGNSDAIKAAYLSGHVFMGEIDIPVIDLRHYLEDELDMHHLSASFSTRARMDERMGHHDNQVMWVTRKPHTPIKQALDALDKWIVQQKNTPYNDVIASKPADVMDRCWDMKGKVVAEGDNVWDGEWNGKPKGDCLARYPAFKNSRWVAGDSVAGHTFKCQLQPVEEAIAKGVYGKNAMQSVLGDLKRIFPGGVCDYQKENMYMAMIKQTGFADKRVSTE